MSDDNKILDELKQNLAELKKQIAESKNGAAAPLDEARVQEMIKSKLDAKDALLARKGSYVVEDEQSHNTSLLMQKSNDQKVVDFQKWNDNCLILSSLMNRPVQTLKYFQKSMENKGLSDLAKSMNTTGGNQGTDWIPTNFSTDLYRLVHLEFKVANLFREIQMPTPIYKIPVVKSESSPFLATEQTSDTTPTKFTASNPQTTNITFTATKWATRVVFTEEISEDSIIPIVEYIKSDMAMKMAHGYEDMLVNGDNSVTHMDSDVTSASDVRKAWKGLRKYAIANGYTKSLSTFSTANLRSMRSAMGKYGVDPSKLAWIIAPQDLALFLGLAEVITMEKYGPQATIVTGELARLDNIPIIVSEKMRPDVNASGFNDSTTNNKGIVLLTYSPGFLRGTRRALTTGSFIDVQTDQTILVNTMRGDFEPIYDVTSQALVELGINITHP